MKRKHNRKETNKQIRNLNFTTLKPKTYLIKIVWDLNKNEKWDTGDVLKNKQPEPVYFFPKK